MPRSCCPHSRRRMSLRSPASLPGSHTVLSVTALLSPLGCAVSQTPLLCHDLDSFGEDRTGVVSNVPLVGYVCYVSSWSEGLVASGKDTPEVRWPSRPILSGSRRPGHLVRVVPAGCPSCLAGRQPLTEAVSLQEWGRSRASQGVGGGVGEEPLDYSEFWREDFSPPRAHIYQSSPSVRRDPWMFVVFSGCHPAPRCFAAHTVPALAVGGPLICFGGTALLSGAPGCSRFVLYSRFSRRISHVSEDSRCLLLEVGVWKPGCGHWCAPCCRRPCLRSCWRVELDTVCVHTNMCICRWANSRTHIPDTRILVCPSPCNTREHC